MVELVIADSLGLCRGADDSMKWAKEVAASYPGQITYSLGATLNNSQIIKDLEQHGVHLLEVGSYKPDQYNPSDIQSAIDQIQPGDVACITAHGVEKWVIEDLKERVGPEGSVHDLTCKRGVTAAQKFAAKYHDQGYGVVLVTTPKNAFHPEVRGIFSHTGPGIYDGFPLTGIGDLDTPYFQEFMRHQRKGVAVIAKTTNDIGYFSDIVDRVTAMASNYGIPVSSKDTICKATQRRQEAMRKLAVDVDGVVVIGDTTSANTTKLVDIAKKTNQSIPVYLALDWKQLQEIGAVAEIIDMGKIGLSAGASAFPPSVDTVIENLNLL
ncbi:hypothetical protein ACFL96_08555 [Thermoproteota archaeon]